MRRGAMSGRPHDAEQIAILSNDQLPRIPRGTTVFGDRFAAHLRASVASSEVSKRGSRVRFGRPPARSAGTEFGTCRATAAGGTRAAGSAGLTVLGGARASKPARPPVAARAWRGLVGTRFAGAHHPRGADRCGVGLAQRLDTPSLLAPGYGPVQE